MAGRYTQANRPMAVLTPLGEDVLLLAGFSATEGLSQVFSFQLDLLAEHDRDIAFGNVLGQGIDIRLDLPNGGRRYFHGVCNRLSQGNSTLIFKNYQMEVVPRFWLLNRRAQSRIFQRLSVPDILKQVLAGLDVRFQLQGTFEPRECCVQYRETDFNFASRLMEEEGIYYYFLHRQGGHQMVLTNAPGSHPDLEGGAELEYVNVAAAANTTGEAVYSWWKRQELRATKYTVWDHHFELPHKHLEGARPAPPMVKVGQADHALKVAANSGLDVFDWPGDYAYRYDDVSRGGGDQSGELQKVFADGQRTALIRLQQEVAPGVGVDGLSNCRRLSSGQRFTLSTQAAGKLGALLQAAGPYLLTGVSHSARQSDYATEGGMFIYSNGFTCLPAAVPFAPPRVTPKPFVPGTQTAVVVGPPDEEIFVDKYGRVKVQFHWDRDGKSDANSSCWVRVATPWAGQQWGMIHLPRVGQEVVLTFLEGNPDRPLIVGSVYNAEDMPPYALPENKTRSGVKSRSTLRGTPENFNELRFEDPKGAEDVYFHAERDFHRVVENSDDLQVGNDQTIAVGHNRTEVVRRGDEHVTVEKGDRTVVLGEGNDTHQLKKGDRRVQIEMGNDQLLIKAGDQETRLEMGRSSTEAMQAIELKVGQNRIRLDQTGITISGLVVKVEGQTQAALKGAVVQLNADGLLELKGGSLMFG